MRSYFICSDIHGFYDEWMHALAAKNFDMKNPNHIIVVLGDLMDRGSKNLQCLEFLHALPSDRKILIRGNHEDLLDRCLADKDFAAADYHNGTAMTVMELGESGLDNLDKMFKAAARNPLLKEYKSQLRDYYEVGDNIFVHGWIPCENEICQKMSGPTQMRYYSMENWREGNWEKARWINGMDAWNQGVKLEGKTIWCGHWHTSWGWAWIDGSSPEFNHGGCMPANFDPFVREGIVAMDGCVAYSHQMNCIVLSI